MSVVALDPSQVGKIGIGVLIGLVVLGLALGAVIASLVGRLVILAIVIALGTLVWQQRTVIEHRITKQRCQLNTTFFGIHVTAPADVVQACQKQLSR